jgi:predicted Zn finger-like uncharacterized protein
MLTQCPNCQTTFRVTREILRVADGQVRCGRCQTQFDALERLIQESDAGEIQSGRFLRPPPARPTSAHEPAIEVEEPITHEDITLEGRHIEISGTYEILEEGAGGKPQVRQEVIEEWVEIDDIDAALDDRQRIAAADDDSSGFENETDVEETRDGGIEVEEAEIEEAEVERAEVEEEITQQEADTEPELDLLPQQPVRRPSAMLWKILAAPLALLLIVQLVHHYRSALARHPRAGAPLMSIYQGLGLSLTPDWNLHAYEIRQWTVTSDPAAPGTLKVRASIKNLAQIAQPYPLLKLVLEDRWGEQVRAREFEPSEYLDPTTAAHRLLAPEQQASATISIVDPGPDAEGFRFDVCLRGASGAVCAADVPERSY